VSREKFAKINVDKRILFDYNGCNEEIAMITQIRVPSRWRGAGRDIFGTADFKLGLGSCGKVVTALDISVGRDYVVIKQLCEGGERKYFHYSHKDVTGRIEVTYA
jgi:hypothetical protein